MKRIALGMLLMTVLLPFGVAAKTLTRCGASEGYRYDLPGSAPKSPNLGWSRDTISKGQFDLILDGNEADIVTTDAVGTRSSKGDGASVLVFTGDLPGTFVVLLAYTTGTIEHFLFSLSADGSGEVVWGTARAQGPFPKGSLMRAACKAPDAR
jgi:hypothetical protein